MRTDTALVLYYQRGNRYGFHALLGALETDECFSALKVHFCSGKDKLLSDLGAILEEQVNTLVCISFMTTQIWDIRTLVTRLREKYAGRALLVAGGPHPTGDPAGTLRLGFDAVVCGEGEETLREMVRRIDRGLDYRGVPGVASLDKAGRYRHTPRHSRIDLDRYPPFSVRHRRFGPIEITRGCSCGCRFCQTPQIFGGRPRHRSVEVICRHVQTLLDRGFHDFRFLTPNAFSYGSADGKTPNPEKLEELLGEIRRLIGDRGRLFFGTFPSEVRPEHVSRQTVGLVRRYANNDNLIIGAQSGSPRLLERCRRGHTVDDVYRAVESTLEAGLKANVDFIFGLPGETVRDRLATARVMRDLVSMGARIHAHAFIPLPATAFARSEPGQIGEETAQALAELIPTGAVYGQWETQERLARRVSRYLKSGGLNDTAGH